MIFTTHVTIRRPASTIYKVFLGINNKLGKDLKKHFAKEKKN